jgi:DNA-binding MarR family transcriptional regulator
MAAERLSHLQRRIGPGAAHHRALVHAMGVDKANLSRSLKGLERKGLVYVQRSEGGRGEAVNLIRARQRDWQL